MSIIQKGDVISAQKMLCGGLDPNFFLKETGETPLMKWLRLKPAIQKNFLDLLIEFNVHFDFRDNNGKCVIHHCVLSENITAVKLLLDKGVSLHEWDAKGIPALFYAADNDVHVNFFQNVLELIRNETILDVSQNNILHHVIRKGLANHLCIILKHFNSLSRDDILQLISAKNSSGNTPVHICILQTNKTCLLMLSRLKICHYVKNEYGDTAIDLAARVCQKDLINILKNIDNNVTISEISDYRSRTLTYRQSLQHCLTYANTLRKSERQNDRVFSSYPPIYKVIKLYKPANNNLDFELKPGECVFVYMVLLTKVAYGYKVLSDSRTFGWFPSSIIGLSSTKHIQEFQKDYSTLSNLIINIPELPLNNQTGGYPLMLFLNLSVKETNIGLEIGQRKINLNEKDNLSTLFIPSPFYVRNIETDSPADICGLRIGDCILYIMSNEITSFSLRVVKTIFKKMLRSKPPPNLPLSTVRQICLIILRQNDMTLSCKFVDDQNDVLSEYFTLNNNSPIDTLGSMSYDLNPKFFMNNKSRNTLLSCRSTIREPYNKPLPQVPISKSKSTLNVLPVEDASSSTSLSLSNLPPPTPDMILE